jgi:hypothetical protein
MIASSTKVKRHIVEHGAAAPIADRGAELDGLNDPALTPDLRVLMVGTGRPKVENEVRLQGMAGRVIALLCELGTIKYRESKEASTVCAE